MQEIFLGEVIRQRRLELGLTQEELCEGICEPMTISRFENGRQTPSRNRIKAILQRLGLPDDRFYGLLSAKELELAELEKELVSCHVRFERAATEERSDIRQEALVVHQKMEAAMDKDDTLTKQEILRSKHLLRKFDSNYGYEEGIAMLLEAMHLTHPNFRLDAIGKELYSLTEVKLINNMACCCLHNDRHYEAIDILAPLLEYLKTHWQKIPPTRAQIPMVAFNYARELEITKQYDKALEVSEYARRICVDYGYYTSLSSLLHIQAECHYHAGNLDKSVELYRQAYYLYKAIEDDNNLALLLAETKELFGPILE